jgi:hypothetical protein
MTLLYEFKLSDSAICRKSRIVPGEMGVLQ